jgi:hypothetical protein
MLTLGTISVITIVTALLTTLVTVAVAFVAPLFSHGVKLAEFRQAWINEQRKDVAEYLGLAREWVEAWDEQNGAVAETAEDREKLKKQRKDLFELANKALVILWRIKMRMNPLTTNPQAAQDKEFLVRLDALLLPPTPDPNGVSPPEAMWRKLADAAVAQSQIVFKGEWEVTKTTMLDNFWDAWKARKKANASLNTLGQDRK